MAAAHRQHGRAAEHEQRSDGMTAQEFREKARKLGMKDREIDMQIELRERFLREGITPIPYEMALAAKQQSSCLEVFDLINSDRHPENVMA